MSSLPTPPRLGPRLPLPPAPRDDGPELATGEHPLGLRVGDLLEGRYQIESCIGEGGVGVVFRALQLKLHRRVAVKLLLQEVEGDEQLVPRFQQEALTLAALSHPNIVSLQDYGLVRGRPFLVLELLEGRTLREILDAEAPLVPARALALTRQIALALAYAHGLGIVHRDLKPANLLVQALPAYEHVKVLDFGMVKLLPGSYLDRGEQLTRIGFTHGTPAYMSPEHALGTPVDGRSDLYSLGIVLFEMLTGEKPYDGEVQDILRGHLAGEVPVLSARRPELADAPGLQALLARLLAKERDDRFASATALLEALDALMRTEAGAPALRAEDGEAQDDYALPVRPSPRELLERAVRGAERLGKVARVRWREEGAPRLARALLALRALAVRLAPKLRAFSEEAWARLRPRIAQVADRISRAAHEAKLRLEGSATAARTAPLALPASTDPDATVVDLSPVFSGGAPVEDPAQERGDESAALGSAPTALGARAATQTAAGLGTAPTVASEKPMRVSDTAEPLLLEPRDPRRTKLL